MIFNEKVFQDYLDGRLSEKENEEVQAWLASHSDDPLVNTVLEKTFDGCRVEADSSDEHMLSSTRRKLGFAHAMPSRMTIWLAAAVAVLLLALPLSMRIGYKLHKDPAPVAWQELSVPISETRELVLPDGTQLTLNACSRITWPDRFDGNSREIFLEGEVLANVTKDPEHPFIIHSSDVDVRVYGTTFNFSSYRDADVVRMLLLEGSVCMDVPSEAGKREVKLTPGDLALYNRHDGDVSLSKLSSTEGYKPFSEGRSFSFFNIPLRDIVADLERSFGTSIVLADKDIASRRFLAFFTNEESLDEILRLLCKNGRLRVEKRSGDIYIYGKR